jgi:hypothetical protein
MTDAANTATGLSALLAGEHAAIDGYGIAGAVLVRAQAPAPLVAAARSGLDAHRASRDQLSDAIVAAGGTPPPPLPAYQLPFPVHDTSSAARLLIGIEDRLSRVAVQAVGDTSGNARLLAADVLAAAAVRETELRLLAGSPVPKAVTSLPGQ